jgi:hypothetical protein
MADFAGAVSAMRERFAASWTETKIAYQNESPRDDAGELVTPWPPAAADGKPVPWVYFEVIQMSSAERGAGRPSDKTWLTTGRIYVHVFTPLDYGYPESLRLAEQAGEIFRAATFYRDDNVGAKVVTMAPDIDGGGTDADNGNWFRVTCSVPFEFFFIK